MVKHLVAPVPSLHRIYVRLQPNALASLVATPLPIATWPTRQVSTVDGFQGREVDVVIFSCVRAPSAAGGGSYGSGIGFLADRRRMNVAITRARRSLVVLGNARRLSSDETWKALLDHAASRGRLEREVDGRAGDPGAGGPGEALCTRLEAIAQPPKASSSEERRETSVRRIERAKPIAARDRDHDRTGEPTRSRRSRDNEQPPDSINSSQKGDTGKESRGRSENPAHRSQSDRQEKGASDAKRGGGGSEHRHRVAEKRPRSPHDQRDRLRENPREASLSQASRENAHERSQRAPSVRPKHAAAIAEPLASTRCAEADGGVKRPPKRARVAAPPPRRDDAASDRSDSRNRAGGGATRAVAPVSGAAGFLGDLLGSLSSNAAGIASGKDHEFREGLRGGEVRDAAWPTRTVPATLWGGLTRGISYWVLSLLVSGSRVGAARAFYVNVWIRSRLFDARNCDQPPPSPICVRPNASPGEYFWHREGRGIGIRQRVDWLASPLDVKRGLLCACDSLVVSTYT